MEILLAVFLELDISLLAQLGEESSLER
jgi:hypothetical protein